MKKSIFIGLAVASMMAIGAEATPQTSSATSNKQLDKHLKEQIQREETYAKTQSFAQGDDYNLSEHQVDPNDLANIPKLEPEYDFNMDHVYD